MRVVPRWGRRFGVQPLARTNHRGFDRAFHSITGDYHGRKEEGRKEGFQEVWREEGCQEGQEVSFRSSTTEKPAPWRRLLSLCHLVYRPWANSTIRAINASCTIPLSAAARENS